ncbi:MAG: hypothetical protein ABR582_01820 [Gemmatimonadaceae bacterium]
MRDSDEYTLLASRVISTLRPDVEQKVAKLTSKFPTLSATELRLRLWIVESIVMSLAAEDSTADPSRLDRFFGPFWSNISKEVQSDLPGRDVGQEFDMGLESLATVIDADRKRLTPEKAQLALGDRITAFLDVPEGAALEYGYKLATSTKLLNQLPE